MLPQVNRFHSLHEAAPINEGSIPSTLLCRGWHCLNVLTNGICAIVIPLAYIICPELVVVIAGNPKGGCARLAERIVTMRSWHTSIPICARIEVIAWLASRRRPRAEGHVILLADAVQASFVVQVLSSSHRVPLAGDPLHPVAGPGPLDVDRQTSLSVHLSPSSQER
jgi:hypothetical protein